MYEEVVLCVHIPTRFLSALLEVFRSRDGGPCVFLSQMYSLVQPISMYIKSTKYITSKEHVCASMCLCECTSVCMSARVCMCVFMCV